MQNDVQAAGLISYEEAANILGKNVQAVRSAVTRAMLHAFTDPQDRRKRLVSRAEVEAYRVVLDYKRAPAPPQSGGLLTYEEAAALLGKSSLALRSLVTREELRTYADPGDKRRRLLSRAEVEAYAVKTYQRSAIAYAAASSSPAPGIPFDMSPKMLGAVAGGIALILLLLFILKSGAGDPATRVLIIGAIAGIALLVIAQWQEEGRISAQEARRLERLAEKAETDPDKAEVFITELGRVIEASGATA